jgi:hypothetical protein
MILKALRLLLLLPLSLRMLLILMLLRLRLLLPIWPVLLLLLLLLLWFPPRLFIAAFIGILLSHTLQHSPLILRGQKLVVKGNAVVS